MELLNSTATTIAVPFSSYISIRILEERVSNLFILVHLIVETKLFSELCFGKNTGKYIVRFYPYGNRTKRFKMLIRI